MRPRDKQRTATKKAGREARAKARERVSIQARGRNASTGRPFVLSVPVTIKANDAPREDGRKPFTIVAYTGEPLTLPRFDLPVVIDCASLDLSAQSIPALLEHQPFTDSVVGQIERIDVQNGIPPVTASGYFTPTDDPRDAAAFVMKKAAAGFRWQASVGGNPKTVERVEANQTATVNGRTYAGPCYIARGAHFREISFTVLGADRNTSVSARYSQPKGNVAMKANEGFSKWLLAKGVEDEESLSEVLRANLELMYAAESVPVEEEEEEPETPAAPAPTNAAAVPVAIQAAAVTPPTLTPGQPDAAAILASERARIAGIGEVCDLAAMGTGGEAPMITATAGQSPVNLQAHAVAQGWDVDRTRREALNIVRNSRVNAPAVIVRPGTANASVVASAIQCALLARAGAPLAHSVYGRASESAGHKLPAWLKAGENDVQKNRVIEASGRYAEMSAVDLCREAVRLDGREVPQSRGEMIQAAFSGSTLVNIFSTNMSARLLAAYVEAGDTTDGWVYKNVDVPNYLLQERAALVTAGGLSKLPAGGEADHDKRSDRVESYKIARYAKQFVVDEMDIINDNLSGFARIPADMGQAARRLTPDLVYAILLANPTLSATARAMFNTTDGNRKTTSALAAATIRTAVSTMWLFTENGVNLNLAPTHIIVPPTLKHLTDELVNSSQIFVKGSTDAERGVNNSIKADNLTIVSDSRLENGVTDPDSGTTYSGSASTWFIACALANTIEVGYLRGTGGMPSIRNWTLSEGKFGRGWDVSISVGAKALDWRGMVKNEA